MPEYESESLYSQIKGLVVAIDPESIAGRGDRLSEMGFGHLSSQVTKQGSQDEFAGALLAELISEGQSELMKLLDQLELAADLGEADQKEARELRTAVAGLTPEQFQANFPETREPTDSVSPTIATGSVDDEGGEHIESELSTGDIELPEMPEKGELKTGDIKSRGKTKNSTIKTGGIKIGGA
jgi:hypothetical protein